MEIGDSDDESTIRLPVLKVYRRPAQPNKNRGGIVIQA